VGSLGSFYISVLSTFIPLQTKYLEFILFAG